MYHISVILSNNFKDLVKSIVKKLRRNISGQTLGCIAVEVCEKEEVELLVESRTVDWNQRAEGEDNGTGGREGGCAIRQIVSMSRERRLFQHSREGGA